jgi:prepilin-type N-terminal cleavage/methylation domain-containing protein
MKTNNPPATRRYRAFTLVELLVVMAVIATLAAMIFPAAAIIKRNAAIKRAQTEMKLVEIAIKAYHANLGFYPPDNVNNPEVNPLFFELMGTTNLTAGTYLAADGHGITNVSAFFGGNIRGFVNVSKGAGDEVQSARNHLVGLKSTEYLEIQNGGAFGVVLGISDKGPLMIDDYSTSGKQINPWRYVSTNPTNNPGHYDLWVDILVGGKTNRICNWSERPLAVAY